MVSFSHLLYNVIQLGCGEISDRNYKIAQNLPYMFNYFINNIQMNNYGAPLLGLAKSI